MSVVLRVATAIVVLWTAGELAQDTVVIHGVVFAGVGEAQKFTDSTVAKTFYDPNRPLGQGLGGHIPEGFLAGTFMLGIAAAATFLWRGSASAVSNRLRGADLSGWDSDCWNIAHWYREGWPRILGRSTPGAPGGSRR